MKRVKVGRADDLGLRTGDGGRGPWDGAINNKMRLLLH